MTVTLLFLMVPVLHPQAMAQQQTGQQLLKDIDGSELQQVIESYEGQKAVLLNMWATWCGPCIEEFPHIVKLQRKYEDRLQVIFVSADFKRQSAIDFLNKHNVNWTTYFKTGDDQKFIESVSEKWTGAMPFTMILDQEGNLVESWEDKADFSTFESNIKKALKE